MKMIFPIIVAILLFGSGLFCLFGSVMVTISAIDYYKYDGYSYSSEIKHDSMWPLNNIRGPYIQTFVWKDGKIIESWYDPIENDSSKIKAEKKAQDFINLMIANK